MKTISIAVPVVLALIIGGPLFLGSATPLQPGDFGSVQSGVTGAIKGFVKDAKTGAPVDLAKITLIYTKNESVKYEIQTDKKGYYYIGGLTPGYYKFSFEKDGFLPFSQTWRVPLGDTAQADCTLQTLDTARPAESPANAKRAMAFLKSAQWEDAVKEFSAGIAGDPANPLLYFYRGLSQENWGRMEEALTDYQKAIELKPDFPLSYSRSAKIWARRQDFEKAVACYQKAVELGDQDITTLYNYAVVLMNLGKNAEARIVLENLTEQDPDYADAYYHLGILSLGQGETEKAKEQLKKFLQLDPENPNAPLAQQILNSLG